MRRFLTGFLAASLLYMYCALVEQGLRVWADPKFQADWIKEIATWQMI